MHQDQSLQALALGILYLRRLVYQYVITCNLLFISSDNCTILPPSNTPLVFKELSLADQNGPVHLNGTHSTIPLVRCVEQYFHNNNGYLMFELKHTTVDKFYDVRL
jgi:hypothetical protein